MIETKTQDQSGDAREREPWAQRVSALLDGELEGEELAATLAYAAQEQQGRASWQLYTLVGDALRSSDLARPANPDFLPRLRERLVQENVRPRSADRARPISAAPGAAANAAVFRWKLLAGLASLATVASLGWTSLAGLRGADLAEAQLAQQAPAPERSSASTVVVADSQPPQMMLRDPRLDELLAAHKQFGSMSALQMPAGFLRNATFETSGQ